MGLSVLITNNVMHTRTGTELFVRDLALELRRQGHTPAIFTKTIGEIAEQLRSEHIPVTDCLADLPFKPDIIHGHHFRPTLKALMRFPFVPAIFVCHDHLYKLDQPPLHPNIYRYYGVSRICMERLCRNGVPPNLVKFFPNFVDLDRFQPRGPLPEWPKRALVFSNYAHAGTQLPVIQAACEKAGIPLDVVGKGSGHLVANPENILGRYDLVFAKAKAAMEAMAVGAAVILCDFSGVGPMVTSAEFESLRPLNFGFQTLREPLQPECLLLQISRYDAADAAEVSRLIRSSAGLQSTVADLVQVYRNVIAEHAPKTLTKKPEISWRIRFRLIRDEFSTGLISIWNQLGQRQRNTLTRLPGMNTLQEVVRRMLFNPKSK